MIKWILICVTLFCLAIAVFTAGQNTSFAGFEGTLLGLNLSVAVLAINFSFVAYQNSEYRQFQRGLAPNLLFGCLGVLLWALIPAICIVSNSKAVGVVALAAIPITGLLSVILVQLAKYEGSPEAIVRSLTNRPRWEEAFKKYSAIVKEQKSSWKGKNFSKPEDMPTHEWSWMPLPPPTKADPFFLLGSIGCIAAKSSNAGIVVSVTKALLCAYKEFHDSQRKESNRYVSEVGGLLEAQLERLCHTVGDSDDTGYLTGRFLDACAIHLVNEANETSPVLHPFFYVAQLMVAAGKEMIKKRNYEAALIPLIAIRQCCIKGVYQDAERQMEENDADINSLFFAHNLANLASTLRPLGTAAIEAGDSNYLYRVFDAFGWLGCTALKCNNREVTTKCLRALAQLGREARAKKLECHWDKCALLPEQHAAERIHWIVSWVPKAIPERRESWLGLCAQAISRIRGKETNLKIIQKGESIKIEIDDTDEVHHEGFSSDAGGRSLDYSDFSMLKDFELYGFTGTTMQGPTVPFPREAPKTDASPEK